MATTKELTEFHFYPKLPMEIKLMIWAFYRQDQSPIWHFMFLTPEGRIYAAQDVETSCIVESTAHSAAADSKKGSIPVDPEEYDIRLTNCSKVAASATYFGGLLDMIMNPTSRARYYYNPVLDWHPKQPTHSWANFGRDVFIFGSGYRHPGQLRFLFDYIGHVAPKDLAEDHWARRIQVLAMFVSLHDGLFLSDLDRRAFTQLNALRKVVLISHVSRFAAFIRRPSRQKRHGRLFNYIHAPTSALVDMNRRSPQEEVNADSIRGELEQLFAQIIHDRKVKVCIVTRHTVNIESVMRV
ncbi:hypothetical protein F5Y18DRAFT_441765 [Xylariaceae sp. FL1019]|nr:hypothetical protein F5Y18DRAFT_441765 [Xylariaceae sp. FL1019]